MASEHWAAELTSYRPSEEAPDFMALVYDPTPGGKKNEDGTTTFSMRFPALILSEYVSGQDKAAADIATQLNAFDDMLETLQWVRQNYAGGSTQEINARLDAAISKAEGKP